MPEVHRVHRQGEGTPYVRLRAHRSPIPQPPRLTTATPTRAAGHHYLGSVDCITSAPGDDTAAVGLSALIHAMYETNRCMVARFVKRANSTPKLALLTPCTCTRPALNNTNAQTPTDHAAAAVLLAQTSLPRTPRVRSLLGSSACT